jgi:hypothetical protein
MVDPKLKHETPCPRCGMLNSVAATHCPTCATALEAARMPDWPTPAPFDLPGAMAACAHCGKPNAASIETCVHCGESVAGLGLVEEAVVTTSRTRARVKVRPQAKPRVGPLLSPAGWRRMAGIIRVLAVLFLIWSTVDSGFWLERATGNLDASQAAVATRFTTYAIYELARNAVLVLAVWLLTSPRNGRE